MRVQGGQKVPFPYKSLTIFDTKCLKSVCKIKFISWIFFYFFFPLGVFHTSMSVKGPNQIPTTDALLHLSTTDFKTIIILSSWYVYCTLEIYHFAFSLGRELYFQVLRISHSAILQYCFFTILNPFLFLISSFSIVYCPPPTTLWVSCLKFFLNNTARSARLHLGAKNSVHHFPSFATAFSEYFETIFVPIEIHITYQLHMFMMTINYSTNSCFIDPRPSHSVSQGEQFIVT